jgi:uncharacterized tellurite resistance protein B-like protein
MGLGKILLGATVAIGAVAAAPFTGGGSLLAGASLAGSLAGTGTIVAAVGAGAAGATVGAAVSSMKEDERAEERMNAKSRGFEDGLKKGEEQIKKEVNEILQDVKKSDYFLVGLAAFCYAVANCDGDIAAEELDELDYYLNYINLNSKLTPAVKGQLTRVKNEKAPFNKITKKLDRIELSDLKSFDEILENIIEADDVLADKEIEIREEWQEYYQCRSEQG